jgi:hypothetical protein
MAESEDLQLERHTALEGNGARRKHNKCPNGNRTVNDNFHIINQIGVCENHRLRFGDTANFLADDSISAFAGNGNSTSQIRNSVSQFIVHLRLP